MSRPIPSRAESLLLPAFVGLDMAQIVVPATADQFALAAGQIMAAGVAGFDTESKPTFRVGETSDGPHTVQFAIQRADGGADGGAAGRGDSRADSRADGYCGYVFQVLRPESLAPLAALLGSARLLKAGFGLGSDRSQIQAKLGLVAQGVLDLNTVFSQQGYRRDLGVRAAVAVVFGQRFLKSKKVTTTNWALPHLTPNQVRYAANDAYAALRVWQALQQAARVDRADPVDHLDHVDHVDHVDRPHPP